MIKPGRSLLSGLLSAVLYLATGMPESPAADDPTMTWLRTEAKEGTATGWFRWAVDPSVVDGDSAQLSIVSDQPISIYVNGQRLLKNQSLAKDGKSVAAAGFDVKSLLRQGRNLVAVQVTSDNTKGCLRNFARRCEGKLLKADRRRMEDSSSDAAGWMAANGFQ